jgi:hypothetical protein
VLLRFCDEEKIQKNTTADHGSLCVLSQANVSEITTCELFEQTPVGALGGSFHSQLLGLSPAKLLSSDVQTGNNRGERMIGR